MKRIGRADDVVMYVHSEFGRRVPENTSLGTDHGTAQVNFVIGNAVKGGMYGTPPSLSNLVLGDNLESTTDFRRRLRDADRTSGSAPTPRRCWDRGSTTLGHVPRRNGEGRTRWPLAPAGLRDRRPGRTTSRHIAAADWNYDRAAHLLRTPASAASPADIQKLADAGLDRAVRSLVHYESIPNPKDAAVRRVGSLGSDAERVSGKPARGDRPRRSRTASRWAIDVKPSGNRPVQPVSDRFFYWLRATMLETRRLGYWWANRMLQTTHPVEQKMALLWHGHFATHENKVRDYRKMMQQIDLFERDATGNIRESDHSGRAEPGDALFPRRAVQREGRAERELRPRGDGTLHDGRRQLLREGRARGRARVHRLVLRQPHLQGRSRQARRGREDVSGPHRTTSTAWTC